MRKNMALLIPTLVCALTACATASVSYSEIDAGDRPVYAEASKFNFLGLTPMPVEQLAALRDDLAEQCGDAGVSGIVARTSAFNVIIGVIEKTELMGYCVE